MTQEEHLDLIEQRGNELAQSEPIANLAAALNGASDAGVSQALILPLLMRVFKQTGLMP